MTDLTKKILDYSATALLMIFAFWLTMTAGQRGFFAYDQSIVFDAGFRIFSGQVPYKDFIAPYGLVVFGLQALFFKMLGVSYFSYVITAAFLNVLATGSAMFLARLIFPSRKHLVYICGLLTATWFYPPFGTPYAEQTAFLFSLFSITLLFAARTRQSLLFFCGVSAFLSLLCKQNAGAFMLPLFLLLVPVLFRKIIRSLAVFSAGFFIAALALNLWVRLYADYELFSRYFLFLPFLLGVARFSMDKVNFLTGLCAYTPLHSLAPGIRLIFGSGFLMAAAAIVFYFSRPVTKRDRGYIAPCVLLLYLFFFQYIFIHSAMNQAENGVPFTGLIFCIAAGLLPDFRNKRIAKAARAAAYLFLTAVIFLAAYLFLEGLNTALSRKVQEFHDAGFVSFTEPELKGLKWGSPTKIKRSEISKEDFAGLFCYLKAKEENFFVFPDFTIFYGLTRKAAPQPLLWFHKGLTYSPIYEPALDKWIVDSLKKNNVRVIILEDVSVLNNRLDDFPLLKEYILGNFKLTARIGIFEIAEFNRN